MPNVVATAHTARGLRIAGCLSPNTADFVEVRLDLLPAKTKKEPLQSIPLPVLLTARHPGEGGGRDWHAGEREERVRELLPVAAAMDWELAFVREAGELIGGARSMGVAWVCSFHDFNATPSLSKLLKMRDRAFGVGADVFKVAAFLRDAADLCTLLTLLEKSDGLPLAVMGMGPLGRASRLLFAASGSVLNYGWLHRPQVPGQFPALLLRERIAEVCG